MLDRQFGGEVTPEARDAPESRRVLLGASLWNEWRPLYLSRADRLGCVLVPILCVGTLLSAQRFFPALEIGASVMTLLILWNQRKPYFTATHLHARRGWLGLTELSVPLEEDR